MKWMSDHFRKTQTKFRDLVLLGKKGALYSTLIRMTNSYGVEKENGTLIDLRLTNQELANFCATTRESVNRMLHDLRVKDIISVQKGYITIHDLGYIKKQYSARNVQLNIVVLNNLKKRPTGSMGLRYFNVMFFLFYEVLQEYIHRMVHSPCNLLSWHMHENGIHHIHV